jgi:hypothetical protein
MHGTQERGLRLSDGPFRRPVACALYDLNLGCNSSLYPLLTTLQIFDDTYDALTLVCITFSIFFLHRKFEKKRHIGHKCHCSSQPFSG